jgi:hypothetical protein
LKHVALTGKYVRSQACLECHEDEHKIWATSRHTKKATKGPAFGAEFNSNIYDGVRRDWGRVATLPRKRTGKPSGPGNLPCEYAAVP